MRRTAFVPVVTAVLVLSFAGCDDKEKQEAHDRAIAESAAATAAAAQADKDKAAAQADKDKAAAVAAQAEAQAAAAHAQAAAEGERLALAKREAPSLVSVTAAGCRCATGHTIVVSCRLQNGSQVPVVVSLAAASETGTLGVSARGNGASAFRLAPGQDVVQEVTTYFSALMGCSSCSASECSGSVAAP